MPEIPQFIAGPAAVTGQPVLVSTESKSMAKDISSTMDSMIGSYLQIRNENDISNATVEYTKLVDTIKTKYEKDEGYSDLPDRVQAELEEGSKQIVSRVGKGVQNILTQKFNERNAGNLISIKNEAMKRDTAGRIAKGTTDSELLINNVIFAKTDKERELAEVDLSEHMLSMKALMAPEVYTNFEDTVRDKSQYLTVKRAIPNMVKSGVKLDIESLKDLNPEMIIQLENDYAQEVRNNRVKVSTILRGADDVLFGIQTKGVAARNVEGELRKAGYNEEADDYAVKAKLARQTFNTMQTLGASTDNFEEMRQMVSQQYDYRAGEAGSIEKARQGASILSHIDRLEKQFTSDPFGYVAGRLPVGDYDNEQDYIAANLQMQAEMGAGNPKYAPMVIGADQASILKDRWEKGTADERFQMAQEINDVYGQHAPIAMQNIGVKAGDMLSLIAHNNNNMSDARLWIKAGTIKSSDIPLLPDEKKDITDTLNSDLQNNEVYTTLTSMARMHPSNTALYQYVNDIKNRVYNAAYLTGDAEKATKMLDNLYNVENDDELAVVLYNKQLNPSSMRKGFISARRDADIAGFLRYLKDDGILSGSEYNIRVQDIQRKGIWVNAPVSVTATQGEGFVLADPTTGLPIRSGGGTFYFKSEAEIEELGRNEPFRLF